MGEEGGVGGGSCSVNNSAITEVFGCMCPSMLIVCIRFLRVCSAYAANSDAYAQHVLKEPFQILNFYAYAEHTGTKLSIRIRIWCVLWAHRPNSDADAQHTHQILMPMLRARIKFWPIRSAYTSDSDAHAQRMHQTLTPCAQRMHQILTHMLRMFWRDHFKFEIFMRMLSVRIKFWCACSAYASNSEAYHRGMSLIGESVLVKYLLFRLSELNRIKEFQMYITVLICEEWKSCKIACRWAARVT